MNERQTLEKTRMKPLGNRVLLKRLVKEETVKGGILLPSSAKNKEQVTAEVIAKGPGALSKDGKLLPMSVEIGDRVLLDRYAGQEVTIEDEEYVIVRDDEIMAIVN